MSQFLDVFQSIMQSGSNLADLSNIHNLIAIFYYLLETQKTEKKMKGRMVSHSGF